LKPLRGWSRTTGTRRGRSRSVTSVLSLPVGWPIETVDVRFELPSRSFRSRLSRRISHIIGLDARSICASLGLRNFPGTGPGAVASNCLKHAKYPEYLKLKWLLPHQTASDVKWHSLSVRYSDVKNRTDLQICHVTPSLTQLFIVPAQNYLSSIGIRMRSLPTLSLKGFYLMLKTNKQTTMQLKFVLSSKTSTKYLTI